jgi:hypothetical protein
VVSVVFVFSASAIAFPAFSPSPFPVRLMREYMIAKERDKIPDTHLNSGPTRFCRIRSMISAMVIWNACSPCVAF